MLTKKDKDAILDAFLKINIKDLDIDHPDQRIVKWFRFGSYNTIQIVSEIIRQMPEEKPAKTRKKILVKDES
jgi:hypothetical protein